MNHSVFVRSVRIAFRQYNPAAIYATDWTPLRESSLLAARLPSSLARSRPKRTQFQRPTLCLT